MEISSIAIGRKIEYQCVVAGIGGSSHLIAYVFTLCGRSVKNFKGGTVQRPFWRVER